MKAWEYYSRMMLADEAHDFLLLCDDGEWKLWEWSTRSYPSWHRNRFAVTKDATKTPEKGSTQEPGTESDDADTGGQSPAGDDNDNDAEGQSPTGDNNDNDGNPEEQSPAGNSNNNNDAGEQSPANGDNDNEDEPGDSTTQGTTPSSNASTTDTHTTPSSVMIDPFAPVPERSTPTSTNGAGSSSNTSDPPLPSGPSSTNSTTSSEANPLNNATGTEDTSTPGRAAASTLNPLRVTLRLGPAKNPTSDAARTATDDDPSRDNHTQLLPSKTTANDASAKTKGKKRSADGNPSTSSKKQKRADAMAEPTNSNSIRNICMRQWNGTQPGGQGLLRNFDSYFKTLSEVDKKSFRATQVAARKVKTAANRATGTTNGD
ncbi:hypothetical protein EDB89DRAFT_2071341 [Lactarius sanguifluus]|nr:hypothetical protein EDB89DRAFT_2071341 [Lactarius sanguifluus]